MSNPSLWVLVRRFVEVTGYCDSTLCNEVENGTKVTGSAITFHVYGSSWHYLRGATA